MKPFGLAFQVAHKSPGLHQLGAVIVHRGKILSHGYNKYLLKPTSKYLCGARREYIHAEVNAVGQRPAQIW